MTIGIGIDTGGTYTDAVAYDFDNRAVLAKGKALTTRENLAAGIGEAMDTLPAELLAQAKLIALSTTLATNACVENKGGRAKLVLMGTTRKTLEWIDAEKTYGLKINDVLCVDNKSSFDGAVVDEPDWEELAAQEQPWFADAQALSVAELAAIKNGGVCERGGKAFLEQRFQMPVVMASELAGGLNMMERGATAMLNARLMPVIEEFMKAVAEAMAARGLNIPAMIVRSDGSLMVDRLSRIRPVETILSGPASSVMGARGLTDSENCLIVDMGGTTTDISIVEGGAPAMTDGIRIGGWRTQIRGVYIDTFGLGGDSAIQIKKDELQLSSRRVQPLCLAAARWPGVRAALAALVARGRAHSLPLHEFLYLVREPRDPGQYDGEERALIELLRGGPQMLGGGALDMVNPRSARLENEGIVMRCGLTPTDVMHIKGDFTRYDCEASVLAARFFLQCLPQYEDTAECLTAFADEVYGLVRRTLYENIARVLFEHKYPKIRRDGLGDQLRQWIRQSWLDRDADRSSLFFDPVLRTGAALVGIGAPTHLFLPEVARALGARCLIPEHAEVANAVGAIIADVTARATVEVQPLYTSGGVSCYLVCAENTSLSFDTPEEAIEAAKETATALAVDKAKRQGALGELSVEVAVATKLAHARGGMELDLGTAVTAVATGRSPLR